MTLPAGTVLGSYEILDAIGAGGMGEVYRALDRNLRREVAIKVLPEAFAEDAERLTRFEREARLLAALNHPAIATIHGMERDGGRTFLVMELVDGDDLGARLGAGPLPLPEALRIARQIEMVAKLGGRSAQVVAFLRAQGWQRVANLEGGMFAWQAAGRPMVSEDGQPARVL